MTRRIQRQTLTHTYRLRVLAVIEASDTYLTGKTIAQSAGLTHKQAIDALNALNNLSKVARIGRKFTARWGRVDVETHPAAALERAFRGFFK